MHKHKTGCKILFIITGINMHYNKNNNNRRHATQEWDNDFHLKEDR
jgi:hypothetical protein